MLKTTLPVALAAALILVGGTVHGVRTNRWGYPPDLEAAAARMPELPTTIGDWEGVDIEPGEALTRGVEDGDIHGFLQRAYTDRRTGDRVSIFLAMGLSGAMVTHDPRACYGGGGIRQVGDLGHATVPVGPDGPPAEFLVGTFRPHDSANPMGVQIHWSFRAGGRWRASESPRVDFAAYPALYKLYAIRETAPGGADEAVDAVAEEFLSTLLPELERSVFAPTPGPRSR